MSDEASAPDVCDAQISSPARRHSPNDESPASERSADFGQDSMPAISLKVEGGRFDEPTWTVATLRDWVTVIENFQEVFTATARHLWEQDHPGEQVPDGFDEATALRIDMSKLVFEMPSHD